MESQFTDNGILHEINPILVAEVDAFADMLEQRNLARDCAITLGQELAAAEAELVTLRGFAKWLIRMDDPADTVGRSDRQSVTLTRIIQHAQSALDGES